MAVWPAAGQVVAASGYQVWHGQLAHFSVLVHPAHRGRQATYKLAPPL